MPLVEVPVGAGFGEGFSLPFEGQLCCNLVPQNAQSSGTSSASALYHSPGIELFATLGTGPLRGDLTMTDVPYWVSGTQLYTADSFGTPELLGTVDGTLRVSMAGNGATLAIIVPGEVGYFLDVVSKTLTEITDPVFLEAMNDRGGVFSVVYVSSFLVYNTPTEMFHGSVRTTNKGRDFRALDFGSADSLPDNIVGIFSTRDELYVLGTSSIQPFRAFASTEFAFISVPGAVVPKGLVSQYGVIEFDDAYVFIGGGRGDPVSIWRGGPGTAQKISTAAVDNKLRGYTQAELAQAYLSVYGEVGSLFLVVSLSRDTLVFDAATSALQGHPVWHTRSTNGGAWDVATILRAYGRNFAGSSVDGKVGEITYDCEKEFGQRQIREFSSPFVTDKTNAVFIANVELVVESGTGKNVPADPQDVNPTWEMFISEDEGRTYRTAGVKGSGNVVSRVSRMRWTRLGRNNLSHIFKFRMTSAVKVVVRKLVFDVNFGSTLNG